MIRDTSAQDRVIQSSGPSRARLVKLGVGAAAVVVLLGFAVPSMSRWMSGSRSINLERLRVAEVHRGTLVRDVQVPGRVVAAVSPTLYAPAAGTISLIAKAGDQVKAGAELARIDSPELANQLKQEEAAMNSLDVDVRRGRIDVRKQQLAAQRVEDDALIALNAAKREVERAELAWSKQAISQVDYLRAKDALQTAEIGYTHAQQEKKLVNDSLRFEQETRELTFQRQELKVTDLRRIVDGLTVRAPVDGMVGSVAVVDKANVAINAPLITVVDLSRLEIEMQIPENYADDLGIGMGADVRFGTDSAKGEVSAVSPEIVAGQVTGRVRFTDAQPAALRQNQRVTVRVVIEEKPDTLMVTRGAFLDSGAGRSAYVLRDGLAERTAIQIGATSVSDVEIVSGLTVGDKVIVSSTEEFKGADKIIVND